MRVLGIDPGSLVTGFAVLDTVLRVSNKSALKKTNFSISGMKRPVPGGDLVYVESGSIRMSPVALPLRLKKIYESLQKVIDTYQPECVALEEAFLARNPQSALKLSHVRGVAMLASALAGLEVYEYSARSVKQAVVGYGQASKTQVQKMVQVLLKLETLPPQNTSDALAVAICHIHSSSRL